MNVLISTSDKNRFEQMRKTLAQLGCKEGAFMRVELLFYEALGIAKTYGDNLQLNGLLSSLKEVQFGVYQNTQLACRTSSQKEHHIHKFVVQFKKAIALKPDLL